MLCVALKLWIGIRCLEDRAQNFVGGFRVSNTNWIKWRLVALFVACAALGGGSALAEKVSDIRATRHNLSAEIPGTPTRTGSVPTRTVYASSQQQVCVFCHTPHGAQTTNLAPLWNRTLSTSTYIPYKSTSMDILAPGMLGNEVEGTLDQPGGSSKLCLSCHDGTLAVGTVGVVSGGSNVIAMVGTGASGVMPAGSGATTGDTRRIGKNLTNDHPISVTYTRALADRDGALRPVHAVTQSWSDVSGANIVGLKGSSPKPVLPLESTGSLAGNRGQIQCGTCHDPHLRETDEATNGNQKFLRLNRFQTEQGTAVYDPAKDIVCLACHDRNQNNVVGNTAGPWSYSAHAHSEVAKETYKDDAADLRGFPRGLPVWRASCSNCHDMHTVQGAVRLLNNGTDSTSTPKAGGNAATEQVCFTCHTTVARSAVNSPALGLPGNVPDIQTDFELLARSMPITGADQGTAVEIHTIGGNPNVAEGDLDCTTPNNHCSADLVESRENIGLGDLTKRHVECTDCHNPHRMGSNRDFRGRTGAFGDLSGPADPNPTHPHTDSATGPDGTANYTHTNIISGPLRGTYGVEPVYAPGGVFGSVEATPVMGVGLPISFDIKRGDAASSASAEIADPWVTREYQICLKCHSNYAYNDNDYPQPLGNRPQLGTAPSGTPSGTNFLTQYTNQSKEFQAPESHKGEFYTNTSPKNVTGVSWGPYKGTPPNQFAVNYPVNPAYDPNSFNNPTGQVDFESRNHRSWHPVMGPTGRTTAIRSDPAEGGTMVATDMFMFPWSNAVGTQTMYCTDCHGSGTGVNPLTGLQSAIPEGGDDGSPWGPHGSSHDFILKGPWDRCTGVDNGVGGSSLSACLAGGIYNGPSIVATPDGTRTTTSGDLCFKCHKQTQYAATGGTGVSGFSGAGHNNEHEFHIGKGPLRCSWCHIAVPHGWKNKALLVNLNDVGPEVLCRQEDADDLPDTGGTGAATGIAGSQKCVVGLPMPAGTQMRNDTLGLWDGKGYTNPPYYMNAMVKFTMFRNSGTYFPEVCGSVGEPGFPGEGGEGACGWMGGLGCGTQP